MTSSHTPFPRTPEELATTINGYEKQIRHFEERIAEIRERIRTLQGQTSLEEVTKYDHLL